MGKIKWQDLALKPINLWSLTMATKNDITGDILISKQNNEKFSKGYDAIDFSKKLVLCDVCGKNLEATKECAWTSCPLNWNEARADIIGQNGNVGYGSD